MKLSLKREMTALKGQINMQVEVNVNTYLNMSYFIKLILTQHGTGDAKLCAFPNEDLDVCLSLVECLIDSECTNKTN